MLKALPPTITVASMNDAQLEMYEDVQLRSQVSQFHPPSILVYYY